MPTNNEQGTGKHGHKDSEEPYPHTKDASQGGKDGSSKNASSSGQHTASSRDGGSSGRQSSSASGKGQSEDASLKSREYKDENGEVHHHTKSYMDQHGKSK